MDSEIDINSHTMAMVRRVIDYECYGIKLFFDECTKEGHTGNETQIGYAKVYNALVDLREKVNEQTLENMQNWDGPLAMTKLYPEQKIK